MNRLVLVVAAALLHVACRDLQYPTGDGGLPVNEPPVVSFVTPAMDQLVPVAPVIQVSARDANGVADVTLSCGGVPLYVWTAPPFLASVDLGHCPATDGGGPGLRAVELDAVARDSLLATSAPVSLHVRIDTSMAQLTVQMPDRGVPGATLSLRIASDRPLGALPTANIGSLAAQVQERADLEPAGSPLTLFDAVFSPLPGLGTDLYDGGTQDIPIEVLEQVERWQLVEIEGRAPNGNATRTVLQILLSRVAWQRSPAGRYVEQSSETAPVATDGGLVLPMQVSSGWLPAYYSHATGTFTAFGRTDLRDAGYTVDGLDDQGRTWLTRQVGATSAQTEYVYVAGPTSPASAPVVTDRPFIRGYARVGGGLCQEVTARAGCAGTFTRSLVCSTPAGEVSSAVSSNALDPESTNPGLTATSAGVYWGTWYGGSTCSGLAMTFAATPGGAASVIVGALDDPWPALMTSLENGSVALTVQAMTGSWSTNVVDPSGSVGPSFFTDAAVQQMGLPAGGGVPPANIVAGRPDGSLVTLHYEDPYTVLESWRQGETVPRGRFRIPGYYVGADPFTMPVQPPDSRVGVDGSVAVLLVSGSSQPMGIKSPVTFGKPFGQDAILFIDPQFRPRWLYRPGSNFGRLFGNRTGSNLYYVDATLQMITALAR